MFIIADVPSKLMLPAPIAPDTTDANMPKGGAPTLYATPAPIAGPHKFLS